MTEPIIEQLLRFSADDWSSWLDRLLSNRDTTPHLLRGGQELHQALLTLYHKLDASSKEYLTESAARVLESTPVIAENAEKFFLLFQLIAYLKPRNVSRFLKRLVFEETLRPLIIFDRSLQSFALAALGKYDVDDATADFVWRSAPSAPDFTYLLTCLRILSNRAGSVEAVAFLDLVVQRAQAPLEARQLVEELHGLIRRCGAKDLFRWICDNEKRLSGQAPQQFAFLQDAMREELTPWNDSVLNAADGYRILLAAFLHASARRFLPYELFAIAHLGRRIEREDVKRVLAALWTRADVGTTERPWISFYTGEFANSFKEPNDTIIEVQGNFYTLRPEFEPEAALISEAELRRGPGNLGDLGGRVALSEIGVR